MISLVTSVSIQNPAGITTALALSRLPPRPTCHAIPTCWICPGPGTLAPWCVTPIIIFSSFTCFLTSSKLPYPFCRDNTIVFSPSSDLLFSNASSVLIDFTNNITKSTLPASFASQVAFGRKISVLPSFSIFRPFY